MTPLLAFRNVERSYTPGVPVLDGVSFSIGEGEVVGLLGRNGSGKTTIVRLAMGRLFPHAGSVEAFGLAPTAHPVEVKGQIGYVGETQEMPGLWRASDVIALHRRLFPKWDPALERALIDRFSLDVSRRLSGMSRGQAQQVALLCAVCHRPRLLLLDEPAGGLDPVARREFLETSIQLLNREGTSILFSSHHMSDVERIGGRVLLLHDGKLRIDTSLDALREEHCVAAAPISAPGDVARVQALPGCLRVRQMHGEMHAVFAGDPPTVRTRLIQTLGTDRVQCRRVPLEEFFVELLGGERPGAAA